MRMIRTALFTLALSLVAAPAFATEWLKIDGIDGESTDKGHEKEIIIESFSVASPAAGTATPPPGSGKVAVHDINITKKIDKASPTLLKSAGKKLPGTVTIVMDKKPANPKDKTEFLVIKLTEVYISSVSRETNGQERVVLSAVTYEASTKVGDDGPLTKRDPSTMPRDYPAIFKLR